MTISAVTNPKVSSVRKSYALNKKFGVKSLRKTTEFAGEVIALNTEFEDDQICMILDGPVRVEVYDSSEVLLKAHTYESSQDIVFCSEISKVMGCNAARVQMVSLVNHASVLFAKREDLLLYRAKHAPETFGFYLSLLDLSTADLLRGGLERSDDLGPSVERICEYLVGQHSQHLVEMAFQAAESYGSSERNQFSIYVGGGEEFARDIGHSSPTWGRRKAVLKRKGIICDGHMAKYIKINVFELIKAFPREWRAATARVNEFGEISQKANILKLG